MGFVVSVVNVLWDLFVVFARMALVPVNFALDLFKKSPLYEPTLKFLTVHRGIVVLFCALPLSFLFECYFEVRNWYYRNFEATPQLHSQRVRRVQQQVLEWRKSGMEKKMCTARKEWLTMSVRTATFKKDCHRIDMNDMRDILELDTKKMTVRCEPLVDMGQLTRFLVPRGYALKIMVEMEDLTVGGLTMGLGMEVNCHKYGLIQETVVSYEMCLSDGRIVTASKEENTDLYYALPWSHGTLGFLMSVELEIIPVKPYMYMRYIPCHSQDEYCRKLNELSQAADTPDMLEATIYSRETAVIMCGWFADVTTSEQRAKVNPVNRWHKEWFYKHVEKSLVSGPFDEYIPLRHYYHRHTRSIFWELEDMIPFGNQAWYRWLFGWLGAPKISFLKLTMTPEIRRSTINMHVVQDIIIPISEMKTAVNRFHEWFEVYPLLVYPIRIYDHGKFQGLLKKPKNMRDGNNWEMYFDLGVYGVPALVKKGKFWDAEKNVRAMEAYTRDVLGYSCPYADLFMNREEFEQMFDHSLYRQVRKKYGAADAFPEIFDKVKRQV